MVNKSRAAYLKKYMKEYYQAHREEMLKQSRRWHKDNQEKAREQHKRWSIKNREGRNEYARNYYKANSEKWLQRNRAWREANPDKVREGAQRWIDANPEKRRAHCNNRRARVTGNGGTLPSNAEQILFEKQEGLCFLCGKLLFTQFDDPPSFEHILPLSRGGRNDISNVRLAHLSCNQRKHTKTIEEFFRGDISCLNTSK